MSLIHAAHFEGARAVGVIDFGGAGEAGMKITIDGVDFTEANTADAAGGVWTNGASAADSATSLAAAINGDGRGTKPKVTAFVSAEGNSVVVAANEVGTVGNLTVTTDSVANCTVESLHDGIDAQRAQIAGGNYVVTAQDILADEINIVLPFESTGFVANVRDTAGAIDAVTVNATVQTNPARLRLAFAGLTDPMAGDIIHWMAWRAA